MRNYIRLVPREPPEGLIAAALSELDTAGLVYEIVWKMDGSIETMLTNPGKKRKMVRCTCSECGQSALLDYAPPDHCYAGGEAVYGFYQPEDIMRDAVRHGDSSICPVCGNPVTVRCAARVGRGEFVADETVLMSADLLSGVAGERPLALTSWRVRRCVSRYGYEEYRTDPMEAYVFEAGDACKLVGWVNAYSGTAGYFTAISQEWRQPRKWSETFGRCERIVGLTPELVAESCLYNSKFDAYMVDRAQREFKSPVPYLRLYQTCPQIENVVVQGAGYLLDEMLDEAMRAGKWEGNDRGLPNLPDLHLDEARPAQMLGLSREEFRYCLEQRWSLYQLRVYARAKAAGDRMRLPEDMELLSEYGAEDMDKIVGRAPVGKALRYLMRQMREWAAANDPYNEYAEYMPDDDRLNAAFLADYWNMAETAGWDLGNPEIRWPKNLITAHDRAMEAKKVVVSAKLKQLFQERYKQLNRYAYASGGLMISPARSQGALNREGELLHHCVAGYGEGHALGNTAIFFIRHTWEPKAPYFTLEFDERDGKVMQNRGSRNCKRTPEVEAFEAEWLAWVHGGCRRKKDGTPVGAKPVVKADPSKRELEQHARQECA